MQSSIAEEVTAGSDGALTAYEADELNRHEATIQRGFDTFIEVGEALLAIRDKRLYRQEYGTFEEYCRQRWGMSRPRAYQLMDASEAVRGLSTIVDKLPATESQARPLTKLDTAEERQEAWQEAVEEAEAEGRKVTAKDVERAVEIVRNPDAVHNHRAQGTGENEWYTPVEYIEAAREVLGTIELDPASSQLAQKTVKAGRYFTIENDGLGQAWKGKIWLNPPYSQPHITKFVEKLAISVERGQVNEAILLTHNYTDTAWFHCAARVCSAICFTRGRIAFVNQKGEKAAPTQGQAFFYFGANTEHFMSRFCEYGFVVKRPEFAEYE